MILDSFENESDFDKLLIADIVHSTFYDKYN